MGLVLLLGGITMNSHHDQERIFAILNYKVVFNRIICFINACCLTTTRQPGLFAFFVGSLTLACGWQFVSSLHLKFVLKASGIQYTHNFLVSSQGAGRIRIYSAA